MNIPPCLNHDGTKASIADCWPHTGTSESQGEWGKIKGRLREQRDLAQELDKKVGKVPGKHLSTNDFTDADKAKLDSLTNDKAHEIVGPAAEPVFAHTAVTLTALGLRPASAGDSTAANRVLGVAVTAGATGAAVRVVTEGVIENPGWGFTAGDLLYVGMGGAITPNQEGGFSQMVGWVVSPTKVFVRVGRAIFRS